jgi:hypothetical protein
MKFGRRKRCRSNIIVPLAAKRSSVGFGGEEALQQPQGILISSAHCETGSCDHCGQFPVLLLPDSLKVLQEPEN